MRIVVGYTPGGAVDITARLSGQQLAAPIAREDELTVKRLQNAGIQAQ